MAKASDRIHLLIIKHLHEEISQEESDELFSWMQSSDENRALFEALNDPERLSADLRDMHEVGISILKKIDARLEQAPETPSIGPAQKRRWIYFAAASILLLAVLAYLFIPSHKPAGLAVQSTDVLPGNDRATLTLADGSIIAVSNAADGTLSRQGHAIITKKDNRLSYAVTSTPANTAPAALVYNTLTTPKAGQYQLVLPDGSKVWLNNASSIRYPISFTGDRREVWLTGEAYFEITKDARKPFRVTTRKTAVDVLGTSFNIMDYDDEPAMRTTLVTGKVALGLDGRQTILQPGDQAISDGQGRHRVVKEADVEEALAWKKGFFHFSHAGLTDVLRQLARWYDVEVQFTIPVPDYSFDGEIGRDLHLSAILAHLEKPDVHFQMDGKKLIVKR